MTLTEEENNDDKEKDEGNEHGETKSGDFLLLPFVFLWIMSCIEILLSISERMRSVEKQRGKRRRRRRRRRRKRKRRRKKLKRRKRRRRWC